MSFEYDINPLIIKKLKEVIQDEKIQKFIIDILKEEQENLNLGDRKFTKDYEKILANYVKMGD